MSRVGYAPAWVIATFFGFGLSPVAPGTVGSAGAIAVAWWLHSAYGWSALDFVILSLLLTGPGIWAAGAVAKAAANNDPSKVVIDEVLGVWLALGGAHELNGKTWVAAFALFRLFDIWKPFPVRQLEGLHGGKGIVADDLGAGLYAALVLFAAGWFNLI
ncbi:MAG: phosphatidylglycerophosphatase A [Acidimicrobiia bacterium]|nr:phosphatidylglycerophosphatase A [Acidimicrobiia bacterium]